MIQRLVRGIVRYGVNTGGIKEDEQEVYTYGYTLLFETSICIAAMGCIGTLFGMLLEVIVFSAVFIPLRSFGGGIHADRDWQCLTLSIVVVTMYCIVLKMGSDKEIYYLVLLVTIIGIIFCHSKIKNIHYRRFLSSKWIAICIYFVCILTSTFLHLLEVERFAEGILMTVFVWLMSLVVTEGSKFNLLQRRN